MAEDLYARGVGRLMVEGGGTMHTQFLTADLADELHLVVAPFFVGDSRARRFVGDGALPVEPGPPGDAGRGAPDRRRGAAAVRAVGPVRRRDRTEEERDGRDRCPAATIRTQVPVPLRFADGYATTARVFTFDGLVDGREHLALGLGDWAGAVRAARRGPAPLVRPHSECLTGDVFGSQRCDCGPQLREAVERIADAGGFLLYLRQEGRGIGLYAKLDAYALQDAGLDTYEANLALGHAEDERDYTVAAQMLRALGVARVALLSNNPDKAEQLSRLGVTVTERVPTGVHLSAANAGYLAAKARRAAHTCSSPRSGTGPRTSRASTVTSTDAATGAADRRPPTRGRVGSVLARVLTGLAALLVLAGPGRTRPRSVTLTAAGVPADPGRRRCSASSPCCSVLPAARRGDRGAWSLGGGRSACWPSSRSSTSASFAVLDRPFDPVLDWRVPRRRRWSSSPSSFGPAAASPPRRSASVLLAVAAARRCSTLAVRRA